MSSRYRITVKLFIVLALTLGMGSAQNKKPYLVIDGTKSPDGRYALAWGIPYTELDVTNMEKLIETIDYDAIRNFLVDLKSGETIATIGTTYFAGGGMVKNHGSLDACWREDSRAVVVVEGGKWDTLSAEVIYIVNPEKEFDQCSDAIPLTISMRRAIRAKLLRVHPGEAESINSFAISVDPQKWIDTNQVLFSVIGEVPKSEDAFFYEGDIALQLSGPETVIAAGSSGGEKQGETLGILTANSAGPIELGMTVAEARAAMRNARFSRVSDGEGIPLIEVVQGGERLMSLYAAEEDPDSKIDNDAKIEFIQVWSPDFQTAEGVRPGMLISLVEKTTCGDLKEIVMSEIESREYASFVNQPSGMSFLVRHEHDTAGNYRDDTMITSRYTPGAKISGIEINGKDIMLEGGIGGIRLDSTEKEVLAIGEKAGFGEVFKGKDEIWEVFGQAVQKWIFPDAGISLDMISDEIGGPKTVLSIRAKAPFQEKTRLGIGLGDRKSDVLKAYADFKTESEEAERFFEGQDVHLVGSIYGGMIFTFKDGKLSEIFLGAVAE